MVDENFLQSAIRIRRNYLKLSNNLGFYKKEADKIIKSLNNSLQKIETLKNQLEGKNYSQNHQIIEMMKILDELSTQADTLENSANPLNEDIEKLAVEEQELFQRIKEKHTYLTDEQIVESVRERLIKEGLS